MGKASRTYCTGGWVGPKIDMGVAMRRKIYAFARNSPWSSTP